jgi:hypothetical protein
MSALYKFTNGNSVLKLVDGAYRMAIPFDNLNRDYQEYLAWIAEGNTPDAADVEPKQIKYITKNTAYDRIEEKYGKDKLNQVFDILDNLDRENRRRYDDAQEIDCSNALVIAMLQSIGINPEDILY